MCVVVRRVVIGVAIPVVAATVAGTLARHSPATHTGTVTVAGKAGRAGITKALLKTARCREFKHEILLKIPTVPLKDRRPKTIYADKNPPGEVNRRPGQHAGKGLNKIPAGVQGRIPSGSRASLHYGLREH
ncbi:unnamed protein product [Calypogeia fissa]